MRTDPLRLNLTRLYWEAAGQGPPLVLVHAGMSDSRSWTVSSRIFGQAL